MQTCLDVTYMSLINLPIELLYMLIFNINNYETYYNILLTNSLFHNVLTEADKDRIKYKYHIFRKINEYDLSITFYELPNGKKDGKYLVYLVTPMYTKSNIDTPRNYKLIKAGYYENDMRTGLWREWYENGVVCINVIM